MADNLAYQEDWAEELIGGKLVMMSPASVNHVFISSNIYHIFRSYLRGKKCVPIADGAMVYLTDENRFVPDMMVVCDRSKIKHNGVHGAPDLVVEVLSPSTAKNDRFYKKDIYAKCGVREYWIVSPSEKSIEIYYGNGQDFIFHDIYSLYEDWMLEQMSEEKRASVATRFKCSLYDDLEISLYDIFYDLLP